MRHWTPLFDLLQKTNLYHVRHLQLPGAVDRGAAPHLHVRLRPLHVAVTHRQEQDRAHGHLLEVCPDRGKTQPVRGRGLRWHGHTHFILQCVARNLVILFKVFFTRYN